MRSGFFPRKRPEMCNFEPVCRDIYDNWIFHLDWPPKVDKTRYVHPLKKIQGHIPVESSPQERTQCGRTWGQAPWYSPFEYCALAAGGTGVTSITGLLSPVWRQSRVQPVQPHGGAAYLRQNGVSHEHVRSCIPSG